MTIPADLTYSYTITVDTSLTVPNVSPLFTGFADMPAVFATAYMVGFIEWVCVEALRPYLSSEQRTVGTHINVSHSNATPVGMQVTAHVKISEIAGKKLTFSVKCVDEVDTICEGTHERFIIDYDKFTARAQQKVQQKAQQTH